jgi:hypothetical protein
LKLWPQEFLLLHLTLVLQKEAGAIVVPREQLAKEVKKVLESGGAGNLRCNCSIQNTGRQHSDNHLHEITNLYADG